MAYTTQANVERAVGGAAILVQLLDKDGDGVADSSQVTDILARADAEVNSAIQVCVELSSLAAPYPNSLIFCATDLAVFYAFQAGTSGMGIPDAVRQRYEDALRWLNDVAERRRTIGTSTRATADQVVGQVDPDPDLDRVSRASLKGFW